MFRFAQHDSGIDKSVIQELCGFGTPHRSEFPSTDNRNISLIHILLAPAFPQKGANLLSLL
jgi:hypothetical protein